MAEVTSVRTVDYMKTCKACGSSWDTKLIIDRCPFCGASLFGNETENELDENGKPYNSKLEQISDSYEEGAFRLLIVSTVIIFIAILSVIILYFSV